MKLILLTGIGLDGLMVETCPIRADSGNYPLQVHGVAQAENGATGGTRIRVKSSLEER